MGYNPHEFTVGGVYMLPLLIAFIIGVALSIGLAKMLNQYRLSKYLYYPPIVFVAMVVMFTILVERIMFLL